MLKVFLFCIIHYSLPPVHLTGSLTPNTILTKAEKLYDGQVKGPESVLIKHGKRGFLAHLVMSPCNHALSVVCRCRCRRRRLCTALPVTGLIIEALYLTNICSYAPSICT